MQLLPSETNHPLSASENRDIAVSIVVPIHNAEAHLRECLDSLANQSLPNIEVLCYDDASTDASGKIAAQFAENDLRFTLTTYPDNRSASQARKDGALAARGRYLMFVDADDYLELDACSALVSKMADLDVDILQFGTNIVTASLDTARVEKLEQFLAPLDERLSGDEPFSQCFLAGAYGYTIWNKIYRTDLAKQAFQEIPDGSYPKAQDIFAYFALAWYARSYQGLADCFYNYRFGAGITGADEVSLERLAVYAKQSLVADAIERFVLEHSGTAERHEAAYQVRQRLVSDCVNQWSRHTAPENAQQGFDILAEAWPMEDLAAALHRQFHKERQYLAPRVEGARSLARRTTALAAGTGTLGVFYHRLSIGGVQRVLSILVPMYLRMGYKVVMLLDEKYDDEAFEFPGEVRQVVLPPTETDYRTRGHRLREVIREEHLDALVYCAGSNPILFYDLLMARSEGLPFILSIHDSAFHSLLHGSTELAVRPHVSKLADVVQVLSEAERVYWSSQGVNAVFLPNPITSTLVDEAEIEVQPGTLLWVGRLDIWVKRCLDAVRAMAIVARSRPDARLYMVGKEWTPESGVRVREEIHRLGLEKQVILCGPTSNVEQYYRRADVVVITSVTECSPMTAVEAKAFGVPIAMYSLPHLATLVDGKGFLSAAQGDVAGLARNIVSILNDRELRQQLSQAGRESLAELSTFDLEAAWRNLFSQAAGTTPPAESQPLDATAVGALISNALDIHTLGAIRKREELSSLRRRVTRLRNELDARKKAAGTASGKRQPRSAKRRRHLRRRATQLAGAAAVMGAVIVAFAISCFQAQWSIAAVLAMLLVLMCGAGAAVAYLHLLRRNARLQRQLTDLMKAENKRLHRRISTVEGTIHESVRGEIEMLGGLVLNAAELARDAATTNQRVLLEDSERLGNQVEVVSRRTAESSWAAVYSDTVQQSQWYRDRSISPGRWAVGYPALYALYRILNETRPESILELGMGQSTKMIAQYAAHYQPTVLHRVVEHDVEWVSTVARSFQLPKSTSIIHLDLTQVAYGDDTEVISYANFPAEVGDRKYDLICIDGPFGGKAKHFARVDVLSILPGCLAKSFVIILDDHDRPGEQNTAREIRRVLRESGIAHHWTEYSGEKSVLIITSADQKYLTSL